MEYLIDMNVKVKIKADSELEAIDIAADKVYHSVEDSIIIVKDAEENSNGYDAEF